MSTQLPGLGNLLDSLGAGLRRSFGQTAAGGDRALGELGATAQNRGLGADLGDALGMGDDPAVAVLGPRTRNQGDNQLWDSLYQSNAKLAAFRQQQASKPVAQPGPAPAAAPGSSPGASGGAYGDHEQYRQLIEQSAREFGIDPDALAAILQIETNGKPGAERAVSHAGAMGLGQFMPDTWAEYGFGGDVFKPADAIRGAANYFGALYRQFGDYALAAAAYQGGPGAIVNGQPRAWGSDGNLTPAQYAQQWRTNYQGIKARAPRPVAPAGDAFAQRGIAQALELRGLGYTNEGIRVSGNPFDGVDCSSLVGWAFGLNRGDWNAQRQYDITQRVSQQQLAAGDLVFFQNTVPPGSDPSARPVTHVGIFLGYDAQGRPQMLHAGTNGVEITYLDQAYYQQRLYGYGRIAR